MKKFFLYSFTLLALCPHYAKAEFICVPPGSQPLAQENTLSQLKDVLCCALSPLQIKRAEQITSYFENSTTRFAYEYVENLHDGRGYTAGRVGFCTGTGDLVGVVDAYCKQKPKESLCTYLAPLHAIELQRERTKKNISATTSLDGFPEAWKKAAKDPIFQKAQDKIVDKTYLSPALLAAQKTGLKTPIARAIFYDTIIQHGDGDDPDSIGSLIQLTNKKLPLTEKNEIEWLNTFLDLRRKDLLHPYNRETEKEWKQSVDRIDKLRAILNEDKNINLDRPILFEKGISTD